MKHKKTFSSAGLIKGNGLRLGLIFLMSLGFAAGCKTAGKRSSVKDVSVSPGGRGVEVSKIRVFGIVDYSYPGLAYCPSEGASPYPTDVPPSGKKPSPTGPAQPYGAPPSAGGTYLDQPSSGCQAQGKVVIIRACDNDSYGRLPPGVEKSTKNLNLTACIGHPKELAGYDEVDLRDWQRVFNGSLTVKAVDNEKDELAGKEKLKKSLTVSLGIQIAAGGKINAAINNADESDRTPDPGKSEPTVAELEESKKKQKRTIDHTTLSLEKVELEIKELQDIIAGATASNQIFDDLKAALENRNEVKALVADKDGASIKLIEAAFAKSKHSTLTLEDKNRLKDEQYALADVGIGKMTFADAVDSCSKQGMSLPSGKALHYWHEEVWTKSGGAPIEEAFWTTEGVNGSLSNNGGFYTKSDQELFTTDKWISPLYNPHSKFTHIVKMDDFLRSQIGYRISMTADGKTNSRVSADALRKSGVAERVLCVTNKGRQAPDALATEAFAKAGNLTYCVLTGYATANQVKLSPFAQGGLHYKKWVRINRYGTEELQPFFDQYYNFNQENVSLQSAFRVIAFGINKSAEAVRAVATKAFDDSGKEFSYSNQVRPTDRTQAFPNNSLDVKIPYAPSKAGIPCGSTDPTQGTSNVKLD